MAKAWCKGNFSCSAIQSCDASISHACHVCGCYIPASLLHKICRLPSSVFLYCSPEILSVLCDRPGECSSEKNCW